MTVRGKSLLRRFGRTIAAIIAATVVSVWLYVAVLPLFEIRTIEVQGRDVGVIVDREKLAKNLLFFPTQKMAAQLLAANLLLERVEFRKKFPHTLIIIVSARTPLARLQTQNRSWLLDKNAVVVAEDGEAVAPVLWFELAPVALGARVGDIRVLKSLALAQAARGRLKLESITALDSLSLRARVEKTDIIFAQESDPQEVVTTLQTLLAGFRIKGTLPKVIDLRFDKPVVTF